MCSSQQSNLPKTVSCANYGGKKLQNAYYKAKHVTLYYFK